MTNREQTEAKVTPEQKAKDDAHSIHDSLHRDNASAAYDLMLKEITDAKTNFKPNSKDFIAYRNTLTAELDKSKDALELSNIWGQRAFNKLAVTNPDGNRKEAIGQRELSPYTNGSLPTDGLTKLFASTLRQEIGDRTVSTNDLNDLASSRESMRNKSIVSDLEKTQTKSYADLLDSKTSTGKSLFHLADVAGAGTNPQNIDGKVTKQDLDALIKAGKEGYTPLNDNEIASLQYLSDNWDSKPEIKNLRQTKNADGTISDGDSITEDSLSFAKRPSDEQARASAEQTAVDNAGITSKTNADLLLNHKTSTGKTLLEAADYFGGTVDGSIDNKDIDALLSSAKNGAVKLSDADQQALQKISSGWNNDPQVLALRQINSIDETGNPIKTNGQYITSDSLKLANGDKEKEQQQQNAEQSKKLDQAAITVRTNSAELAGQLNSLKFGKNDLFTAADIYGAAQDGVVNKSQVDGKVNDGDLKKLASVLLVSNGADSAEYKLVTKLINDWNSPEVKALRGTDGYISVETMKAVGLS